MGVAIPCGRMLINESPVSARQVVNTVSLPASGVLAVLFGKCLDHLRGPKVFARAEDQISLDSRTEGGTVKITRSAPRFGDLRCSLH